MYVAVADTAMVRAFYASVCAPLWRCQVLLTFRMPTSSLTVDVPPTYTMAQVKAEIEVRS